MKDNVTISGYIPGAIGSVTRIHSVYYGTHWGFTVAFEAQVACELSEFLMRYDSNSHLFRVATIDDTIIGSIAIDGKGGKDEGARLRWFITAEEYRGRGIGKRLMDEAAGFSRKSRYRKIFLWTFRGLNEARRLYEKYGFRMTEEYTDSQWGPDIVHQKFELEL